MTPEQIGNLRMQIADWEKVIRRDLFGETPRDIKSERDPRTGPASWARWPGRSHCMRCETAWGAVDGHSTPYNKTSGMFPLCKACWAELTPDSRLPFYRVLYEQWAFQARLGGYPSNPHWSEIEAAVLAGR